MYPINHIYFLMKFLTKLILSLLQLMFINFNSVNAQNMDSIYPEQVGNIKFDPKIDDINFKICNSESIFQYYNFSKGFQYKGEKFEILKKWEEIKSLNVEKKGLTGYITIRFLVNCEGNTGLFRVQQMDENYKPISFDNGIKELLLNFVKSLNGWIIAIDNNVKVNYYQYLTFLIKDGIVKEILP
ncbi:hypothetical protein EAVVTKC53_01055 [Elizabethkingia anophelis]|nr:hypothetical protein EAVVTKC53_01924 [Elizabethkingia anophelis]CAI9679606.1 hypothetical protein EAVVTKC53_01055 [Elizabethkingia anophelis]